MEAGFAVLIAIVTLILGAVVGALIGKRKAERQYVTDAQYTQGTLNIDNSDPEFEPNIFLGLSVPVHTLVSRKYVTLDINVMTQNSHE